MIAIVRKAAAIDVEWILALDPLAKTDVGRSAEISEAVSRGECIVAVERDRVVGYAISRTDFFGCGFVWLLVVAVDRRREGVAEQWMATIERTNPTENSSHQPIGPTQQCALLEKRGYAEVGAIEGLDEGDPEVFYMKRVRTGAAEDI